MTKSSHVSKPILFPLLFWIVTVLIFIGLLQISVKNDLIRNAVLLSFVVCLVATFKLLRTRALQLGFVLLLGLSIYLIGYAPKKATDLEVFRRTFSTEVVAREGVPYKFAGEGQVGLDATGLIRSSIISTYIKLAFVDLNFALLKDAYELWSQPFSLRSLVHKAELGEPLGSIEDYSNMARYSIQAGDILISPAYQEAAVYVGDSQWVSVDSQLKRVSFVRAPFLDALVFKDWAYWVKVKVL